MATGTTRVYLGHLLVNSVLKDLDRRQSAVEMHSPGLANIWLDNFEKSPIHQRNAFLMQFSYLRVNYRLYYTRDKENICS